MSDWLVGTLLATSALALLVLLIREPVRARFGSRVTYGLWLIPAVRLFMPSLTHTVERTIPLQSALQVSPRGLLSQDLLWMARVAPADPSLFDRLGGWPAVLLTLWLSVAAALFLSRMIAFHRDRRAILASSEEIAREGAVRIIRTTELGSPVALGIFRPLIAVPMDFEARYRSGEQRLVLDHELAHHRSGDLVANLFAFVLLCLQWFNPLAWVAHAAFRFDQEAACDARVLDKATAADRADYGMAIAKAASGRALLFASALDRPSSLQRRLQSMLHTSNPKRRLTGRVMIVAAIAVALPATASRAVKYLDVPMPAAATAVPAVATAVEAVTPPLAAVRPAVVLAAAQAPARPGLDDNLTINEDRVTIDGKTKRWEELTPAEKARVQAAVAKARVALDKTHIDQAKIDRDLANIPDRSRMAEMQAELAKMQANLAESVARMNAKAAAARAAGRTPDQLDEAIRSTLQSVQSIDLSAASRALANVDRDKIRAGAAGAQQSVEKAKAELARIQARIDAEQHQ